MEPDDHRMASRGGNKEDGLGSEEDASTNRARLRLVLATFTLVVVLALIVIGIVRIVQA